MQPFAKQGVLRLQQDFPSTGNLVGLSLTGIQRDLADKPDLRVRAPERAVTGGVDGLLRMREGEYQLSGFWGFIEAGRTCLWTCIR